MAERSGKIGAAAADLHVFCEQSPFSQAWGISDAASAGLYWAVLGCIACTNNVWKYVEKIGFELLGP
jgi:hypothetical protein